MFGSSWGVLFCEVMKPVGSEAWSEEVDCSGAGVKAYLPVPLLVLFLLSDQLIYEEAAPGWCCQRHKLFPRA